jgi:benzoyl-CoA reductase/2-hydroxyglutaryl-CoA dehydratase subunit BcrC/BadD/HgdB
MQQEEDRMEEDRFLEHMERRPATLSEARKMGQKVVGYLPGGYVPEELIYAAGAIPVCLCEGGSYHSAELALSRVPNVICPFARGQIGEMMKKSNPYYGLVDLVVVPVTCQHLKKVAEIWEYQGELPVVKLGVPHQQGDLELEYFTDRLKVLGKRLENLTGEEITDERLSAAIGLYDRMRNLLREIGLLRRSPHPPLSAAEFVRLNHWSLYADPEFAVEELERLHLHLKAEKGSEAPGKPRFLLLGPNLSHGDSGILDLIEAAGGQVVAEEFFEGLRYCWQQAGSNGAPLDALARFYLRKEIPPAFTRSSARKRLDFVLRLIEEFRVDGVVWYELLCCETYDQESYFFFTELEKRGIPMLIVESDYTPLETGQLKTRLGAFIELIQGGAANE